MNRVKQQMRYNCSARTTPIRYIVIHDTGNPSAGADAESHFRYFNGGNRSSSADIFVDSRSVWQVNDYTKYYSWHCGDGRGKYGITNQNSVGVELCINQDGNYAATLKNAAAVVRELMAELKIPMERVVRHYDVSKKNCPASMSADGWKTWQKFKQMIEGEELSVSQYEELKKEIEVLKNPMIYNYIDENMPAWARPTIQKLVDKGILKGDENGLNLTEELLRMLVINDRAGLYE